jgi:hypothetical protein
MHASVVSVVDDSVDAWHDGSTMSIEVLHDTLLLT